MLTFAPLWTDIFFYGLVVVSGVLGWKTRTSPARFAWHRVFSSHMGMSTAITLLFFVIIALLDSFHFQVANSGQVKSVLDWLLAAPQTHVPKSYTAPFEIHFHAQAFSLYSVLFKWMGSLLISFLLLWCLHKWLTQQTWQKSALQLCGQLSHEGGITICWRTGLLTYGSLLFLMIFCFEASQHYHLFGTDKVGQDVFYQTIKSIRTGLLIGTLTTLVTLPIAILLGLSAGYFGGWIDDVIQYVYTVLNSIPSILLIAASVLVFQVFVEKYPHWFDSNLARGDFRLLGLCFILGLMSWTGLCRLIRAETLKLREREYVQAAYLLGVSHFRILIRHILPNVMYLILITIVMDFSSLVLAEAVLSYVGIGVDPSMQSWGNMINSARLEFAREPVVWWNLTGAFILMLPLVLAANLFSDVVSHAFDPRQ